MHGVINQQDGLNDITASLFRWWVKGDQRLCLAVSQEPAPKHQKYSAQSGCFLFKKITKNLKRASSMRSMRYWIDSLRSIETLWWYHSFNIREMKDRNAQYFYPRLPQILTQAQLYGANTYRGIPASSRRKKERNPNSAVLIWTTYIGQKRVQAGNPSRRHTRMLTCYICF